MSEIESERIDLVVPVMVEAIIGQNRFPILPFTLYR